MELFNAVYPEYFGLFAPMAVGDKIPGSFAEHHVVGVYGTDGYFVPADGVVGKLNLFFIENSFI